jgi:hypothetical protein
MAKPNTGLNLDEFNVLTQNYVDDEEVYDQVFITTPTLEAFKKAGMIQTGKTLNKYHDWPIKYKHLPEGVWVARFHVHTLEAEDILDRAQLQTRYFESTISLAMQDLEENQDSPQKIADLLSEELNDKLEVLGGQINGDIYNDGSDPLAIIGLQKVISVDRSYAGIDSTSYPWWEPIVCSTSYTSRTYSALIDSNSAHHIRKVLKQATLLLQQYKFPLSDYMILAPFGFARAYDDASQDYLSINMAADGKKVDIDMASRAGTYAGVPIIADNDCPATSGGVAHVYFISKKYTRLALGKTYQGGTNKGLFTFMGWEKQTPQQSSIAAMLRMRGVMYSKVPARLLDLQCDGTTINTISTF